MMRQRRQGTKDRLQAGKDCRGNLKAEFETRKLHEKIDHRLAQKLCKQAEMHQFQIELLEERLNERR